MEQGHEMESAEAVVRRFSEVVKSASKGMQGDLMWTTEIAKLFGDGEMLRATGDEAFRGQPHLLEQEFVEAYEVGGPTRLKALFIERLYQATDAKTIVGIRNVLEKILDFQ